MPSAIAKKALENKAITKKQYDKLPAPLLEKVAKHNLELQKKARKKPAAGGVKEKHTKLGKQAHKRGRPKKGTDVKVSK